MLEKILSFVTDIKLVAGTIVTVAGLVYGSYEAVSHFFIPRIEAATLVEEFKSIIAPIQKRSIDNSVMIIENRIIILERKIVRGEKLTPTEKLQYDRLKRKYTEFNSSEF